MWNYIAQFNQSLLVSLRCMDWLGRLSTLQAVVTTLRVAQQVTVAFSCLSPHLSSRNAYPNFFLSFSAAVGPDDPGGPFQPHILGSPAAPRLVRFDHLAPQGPVRTPL